MILENHWRWEVRKWWRQMVCCGDHWRRSWQKKNNCVCIEHMHLQKLLQLHTHLPCSSPLSHLPIPTSLVHDSEFLSSQTSVSSLTLLLSFIVSLGLCVCVCVRLGITTLVGTVFWKYIVVSGTLFLWGRCAGPNWRWVFWGSTYIF